MTSVVDVLNYTQLLIKAQISSPVNICI